MISAAHATHIRGTVRPRRGRYGTRYYLSVHNEATGLVIYTDDGWADFQVALNDARVIVGAARLTWFLGFRPRDVRR